MRELNVFTKQMLEAFDFERIDDNFYLVDMGEWGFRREVLFDPNSTSILVVTKSEGHVSRQWLKDEDALIQYFREQYEYEADYEEEWNELFTDNTIKDWAEYMNNN